MPIRPGRSIPIGQQHETGARMSGYEDWIGRGESRTDSVSNRLIDQFRATLPEIVTPDPVPLGLFWALAPDALPPSNLGRDGHARLGKFLPQMPLTRRMWAGGEVVFVGALSPGDMVEKDSRIERIAPKTGSTGALIFVSVRNCYSVGGIEVVSERQDLVYRAEASPGAAGPDYPPAPDLGQPLAVQDLVSDPVRLFRFSAMTFNGHRIHYDVDYARNVEGYGGLVVHGPMQAVAMLNLAAKVMGACPKVFTYRGLSPLICGEAARTEAYNQDNGLTLRVVKSGGAVTMQGSASL